MQPVDDISCWDMPAPSFLLGLEQGVHCPTHGQCSYVAGHSTPPAVRHLCLPHSALRPPAAARSTFKHRLGTTCGWGWACS